MLENTKDIKTTNTTRKSYRTSVSIKKFIRALINSDVKELIICFIGIFISRSSIIGELFPCSIAFLCSYYYTSLYQRTNQFSRAKKPSLLILILTIFSIASVKFEIKYMLICIFIYIYYTSVRKGKKTVLLYDIFAFALILFTINFIIMIYEGYVLSFLLINIFEALFIISSSFLIKEVIVAIRKKNFNAESVACLLAIIFIAVLGFREVQAMGFNILLFIVFILMILILSIGFTKEIYIIIKRNYTAKEKRKSKIAQTSAEEQEKCFEDINDTIASMIYADTKLKQAISQKISAKAYCSRLTKQNSDISGDNFYYRNSNNKFFAILCDGMGTGQRAFNESKDAINLIIKLLDANFNEEQLVNTLNSLLLLNLKDDRYVALDFSVIDFNTSELRFYKAGAAHSYLISDDEVKRLQASSLPVGILESFNCYHNKINIKQDDLIIMITDGISDSIAEDEQKSLDKYLQIIKNKDPQNIADAVLNYALRGCDKVIDDMTVIVIKIE
jgi:serine/threonine protein phosphatase PrpC